MRRSPRRRHLRLHSNEKTARICSLDATGLAALVDAAVRNARDFIDRYGGVRGTAPQRTKEGPGDAGEKAQRAYGAVQESSPARSGRPTCLQLKGAGLNEIGRTGRRRFEASRESSGQAFQQETMAGELGFEPRQTESESVVLPLHHSPTAPAIIPKHIQQLRWVAGRLLATDQQIASKWGPSTR